jgi:hypothetical protein
MLYAMPPQGRTAGMITRDEGEHGVVEDAHRPVRGAIESTSPVQIFLDSGCIAGNYIREDIANKLVRKLPHFYTHAITNVCGAFGECPLSKKKLHIRVKIFEDGSYKEFDSDFKVLRKLPYEVIVGRRDMVKHRLTLPQNESDKDVPWERRVGHPVLQIHPEVGAHIDGITDHLFVSAQSGTVNKGTIPPARAAARNEFCSRHTWAIHSMRIRGTTPKVPRQGWPEDYCDATHNPENHVAITPT